MVSISNLLHWQVEKFYFHILYTVRYWEIEIRNKTYLVVVPPLYLVGHFIVAILYLLLILDFSGSFFMTKFLIEYKEYGLYYGVVFSFIPAALVMAVVDVKEKNIITKFQLENMPRLREEYIKDHRSPLYNHSAHAA